MGMEYDSTDDRLQTVDIIDLSVQLQRLLFHIVVFFIWEKVPTFHAHDYMLAIEVYSLMVLIIRDSPWSYNRLWPKCGITLSVFFRYLQQNPKWPEFSNEQLQQKG